MQLKTLCLDRVFDVVTDTLYPETATAGLFSFESNGKRYFGIKAYGAPCPQAGQTMTALLERPEDWQSLLGFIVHETQTISCQVPRYNGEGALLGISISVWMWYLTLAFEEPHVLWIAMGVHASLTLIVTAQIFKGRKIRRLLRQAYRAESG